MSKVIDNYLIQKIIGAGNYGNVHLAEHIKTHKKFAVKVINKKAFHKEPILNKLIKNEILALKNIDHPNIIKFYEIMRSTNNTYFVYEYCNGGNLHEMITRRRNLSERQSLEFFRQLISAFKVLQKDNIIHRDIKPENILLQDDRVKLADFGFCQKLNRNEFAYKRLGSPLFMAPEILSNGAYDGRCDIYSLGCVLFSMVYGRGPYMEHSMQALI